jgi:hypothetical protein
MDETTRRRRLSEEIQNKIRPVLMAAWDPIGVGGIPEAADEYDSYIGGIYVYLRDGASDEKLAERLADIETTTMGLSAPEPGRYGTPIGRLRSLTLPRLVHPLAGDGG